MAWICAHHQDRVPVVSPDGLNQQVQTVPPYSSATTSIRGLMVSISWYMGYLKGQLGGAGIWVPLGIPLLRLSFGIGSGAHLQSGQVGWGLEPYLPRSLQVGVCATSAAHKTPSRILPCITIHYLTLPCITLHVHLHLHLCLVNIYITSCYTTYTHTYIHLHVHRCAYEHT